MKKFRCSWFTLLRNSFIKSFMISLIFYTFISIFRSINYFSIFFVVLFFSLPVFLYRNYNTIGVTSDELRFYHFFLCYRKIPLHQGVIVSSIVPRSKLNIFLKLFGPYYCIHLMTAGPSVELIRCLSFKKKKFNALMQEIHSQRNETFVSLDNPNDVEEITARLNNRGLIPTIEETLMNEDVIQPSINDSLIYKVDKVEFLATTSKIIKKILRISIILTILFACALTYYIIELYPFTYGRYSGYTDGLLFFGFLITMILIGLVTNIYRYLYANKTMVSTIEITPMYIKFDDFQFRTCDVLLLKLSGNLNEVNFTHTVTFMYEGEKYRYSLISQVNNVQSFDLNQFYNHLTSVVYDKYSD